MVTAYLFVLFDSLVVVLYPLAHHGLQEAKVVQYATYQPNLAAESAGSFSLAGGCGQ